MSEYLPEEPATGLDYAQQYRQEEENQARDVYEYTWDWICPGCRRSCNDQFCDVCGKVARWRRT